MFGSQTLVSRLYISWSSSEFNPNGNMTSRWAHYNASSMSVVDHLSNLLMTSDQNCGVGGLFWSHMPGHSNASSREKNRWKPKEKSLWQDVDLSLWARSMVCGHVRVKSWALGPRAEVKWLREPLLDTRRIHERARWWDERVFQLNRYLWWVPVTSRAIPAICTTPGCHRYCDICGCSPARYRCQLICRYLSNTQQSWRSLIWGEFDEELKEASECNDSEISSIEGVDWMESSNWEQSSLYDMDIDAVPMSGLREISDEESSSTEDDLISNHSNDWPIQRHCRQDAHKQNKALMFIMSNSQLSVRTAQTYFDLGSRNRWQSSPLWGIA